MSGMGMSSGVTGSSGAASALLSGPSDADMVPDDATMSPKEIDTASATAIADKKAFDYHDWLGANYRNHNGLGVTQSPASRIG